ncbi:hypothetical protein BDK51DRAFT_37985 [Blyttiomyces helicus]|uniref:Glycerophosphocholine acyltransferase 1 n=1 Tax=Blyttiomyces helicus TaxID=388810 RepID=A0A4P9WDB5_9FUNG|nr:hypothetical protein BDK51DRAFT_37985 [Blyttiomyces helicus]|eukprot:RKO88940.1 hypothetical protein BDK51DRAFT_37985 [Blyttiomyces helicus]
MTTPIPPAQRPLAFMALQLLYTFLTLLPTPLMYASRAFHALVLASTLVIATVNGAGFYFDVFARSYEMELERLERDLGGLDPAGDGNGSAGGEGREGDRLVFAGVYGGIPIECSGCSRRARWMAELMEGRRTLVSMSDVARGIYTKGVPPPAEGSSVTYSILSSMFFNPKV